VFWKQRRSSAVLKAIDNEEAQVALLDSSEFSMQQPAVSRELPKRSSCRRHLTPCWYLGNDSRSGEWRSEVDDFLTVAIKIGQLSSA
jgi:uncharacterized Fe-S cluster-containing protein